MKIRTEDEERHARHNLRRRAIRKRELLQTFQRRRVQNFLKEDKVTGCTRAPPTPPPREDQKQHHQRRSDTLRKDWASYKRDGFIWSDLSRTPKSRLSLVVPPFAVKQEREFIKRLLAKVEVEDAEAQEREREKHERTAAQRARLRMRVRHRVGFPLFQPSTHETNHLYTDEYERDIMIRGLRMHVNMNQKIFLEL